MIPIIFRIVVDFPAPFGPRMAMISPLWTSKEISERTCLSLKDFIKFFTVKMVSILSKHPLLASILFLPVIRKEIKKVSSVSEFYHVNLMHVTTACSFARPFLTACCRDMAECGDYKIHSCVYENIFL